MSHRWTEEEATAPLDLRVVVPALAAWAGCLVALWATSAAVVVAAVAALLAIGLAMAACAMRDRRPWTQVVLGAAASLACLAGAAAAALVQWHGADRDPLVQAAHRGDWAVVTMTVAADAAPVADPFAHRDDEESAGGGSIAEGVGQWRITGNASAVATRGRSTTSHASVSVFARGERWSSVRAGQTIVVRGPVQIDTFAIIPSALLRAVGDVDVVSGAPWWSRWAGGVRAALRSSASVWDDPVTGASDDRGGLLRGLVVGDTGGIDDRLEDDAKATGLTHLVAVSGSHVVIVSGIVMVLFRRFGPRASAVAAAVALAGMVILVGPGPSVLRAVVMGAIALLAAVVGRARAALSALACAVLALLLADPALAASPGFALSVQATAGLILLAPPWVRALRRRGVPAGWAQLVVIPVAAHVMTMPVVASLSGSISLVAIPANIAVTPVVAPAMVIGLVCAVVGPWWPAAGREVARVDGPLLDWVAGTAHRLAQWPAATVSWPASTAGVLLLAVVTVLVLLLFRHRPARAVAAAICVGVAFVLISARLIDPGWPARGWLLTACDVGQGDGMVLATGEPGAAVVVDTGPSPDAMDSCLDRLGVTAIPLLVVTHLHADHVGGIAGAVHGRRVDAIAIGPDRSAPAVLAEVTALAQVRGIPVAQLRPEARWHQGALALTVLGPAAVFHGTDSDPNNNSVVLMAEFDGIRILMTGDIERPAQQALLDSGVDLHADVLKQPHHGSAALLSTFVQAVHPHVAVIGVGRDNDYGHPTETALREDADAGVTTVLRTDRDGDVQVSFDGETLRTVVRGRTGLAR